MMRLYDRMRARVPYFESRKVLLVLSCSQFKTLAVKSQLPQTKSSSEQDTVRMPEQAVYQSFGHEFHEQRVGCSQALYFMFGKYARKVLSPCCSRGSSEVVPLCLTSDHVTPDKALTAVKPRYICQYMEPRSGPSTDAGDDAGANNDIIDGVSSQLHATTIVRDIICGTSDFFVERAKKTCGGIERFLYNTETKSITGVSARTAQIGLNSSILGDGSAHEEEVCSSSAVITSEQPAGKYFCTAPSTGRMAGNSRSQQVQMSGGELSTKFTLISSEVCTAGPTVGCSAGSATVLAPSLLESPVPATVDSSELEVLYYAELDLILVCQEITHNVTTDTLDIKMGRGSFLELDVEAQDLLDYLIMAHSCLKHRLIESVRELPID